MFKSEHFTQKYLVVSQKGYGFLTKGADLIAQTRSGKQILNLPMGQKAFACLPVTGDTVAVIGTHRKMLIFKLDEIPELTRGRGVILQRYKDSLLADIKIFVGAEGLSWRSGERIRIEKDIRPWIGARSQTGKLPPVGFPKSNRF